MCDWKGPFNRIVLAGLFLAPFLPPLLWAVFLIEECIILFMTFIKALLQALEPVCFKALLFCSQPIVPFKPKEKEFHFLDQALFSSFLFKSRLVLITTHFHLGLWHIIKCRRCVWKPACEYTHTDGTRTDTFIYWGENIAQVVICWGIKKPVIVENELMNRNMCTEWKTTSNLFLHLEPDHHTPFVLVQVNRDWGDGQRKSSAIFCYLSLAKWHSSGSRRKYESVIGILKVEVHIAAWGILRFRHA